MKRLIAVTLSFAMFLVLFVPALAAEVTPTPPSWVKTEEYAVFAGDAVYQSERWPIIVQYRADAAENNPEPVKESPLYTEWCKQDLQAEGSAKPYRKFSVGEWFERGLIGMQYGQNSASKRSASTAASCFYEARKLLRDQGVQNNDVNYRLVWLWEMRAELLTRTPQKDARATTMYMDAIAKLDTFLKLSGYQMGDVYNCPILKPLDSTFRSRVSKDLEAYRNRVDIKVDGTPMPNGIFHNGGYVERTGAGPQMVNDVVMTPIRDMAELLGATVEWVAKSQSVQVTRAGMVLLLPVGKTTATVNGKPVQMPAAPFKLLGSTLVPAQWVAERLGQKVEWNEESRTMKIGENRAAVGNSNLEAWALGMNAIFAKRNSERINIFGSQARYGPVEYISGGTYGDYLSGNPKNRISPQEYGRVRLRSDWGIEDRKDLVETVCRMTASGHNEEFLSDVEMIKGLSNAEYQQILNNAQGMDKYMFPFTKHLGEKWGSRGIICWDLFRMSMLVQWGYLAGYLTYPEALALLEPAANQVRNNFSSWDEACENYVDGYNWWSRADVIGKNIWETERGKIYKMLQKTKDGKALFDNSLFQKPVTGVPGLTAEHIWASVQSAS